ncbi:MAG TPA: phosphoenolpyruvate synthase [Acidimicrobiales bacterium]|nr:phosphoenolpyruvate synthase [Acidimicrobiales bacterium]
MTRPPAHVIWLEEIGASDTDTVGGKNASLGEMSRALADRGIRVPEGFATTADAYRGYLAHNQLEKPLSDQLAELDPDGAALAKVGQAVREMLLDGELPPYLTEQLGAAYRDLSSRYRSAAVDVAVRSSATAEDLPEASFAGQQDTFLNVVGEDRLFDAVKRCYASLFTDRAIAYRQENGFDHLDVALSVGVQKMVRSDRAGSGVMFTIDTEHGFPRVVMIDAAWGLGEMVVQGRVDPDEYVVFKPLLGQEGVVPIVGRTAGDKRLKLVYAGNGESSTAEVEVPEPERRGFVLSDEEVVELARWGCVVEEHYRRPMDIEWAKDGDSGDLFVVQARPETVQSRRQAPVLRTYRLVGKGARLVTGLAVGDGIASGRAFVLGGVEDFDRFEDGGVIVTEMTDPDWVPIMRRAAAVVTDHGGRTAHAAIVSRELGVPAVVGTGRATAELADGQEVTVSCAEGDDGYVYEGTVEYEVDETPLEDVPPTTTRIMVNLAEPAAAFRWWRLPADGVGLARMEFIVNNAIKVHPLALTRYDQLEDELARRQVDELVAGAASREEYFVDRLAQGIARIAAAHHPNAVIVRMSDFKTNEYADLVGGRQFEPKEANPMLGWRGASRYYSAGYRDGFALECLAVRRAREQIGLGNVMVMIPFCRTPEEADRVLETMADEGLVRGRHGLEVFVMCEVPSNVILVEEFAARFDGFSIGSNDLTQLVLGVDRDSGALAHLFDETNPAVTRSIADLIERAHRAGVKVGICGEAPSNHPEFAEMLVEAGIDSISVSPDRLLQVKTRVAEVEARRT